ncbi:TetR/AcrR family transcriptional regulator [Frateuria defendens]|uniref:TetR/AcrR family transcriptional regulator n=1 Tax=Frateuria defendens TaxID=2219559 RepID=UPI00066FDABC|nr:TetR/AcrR family transcriptional regulator [Frateuria defendens]
MPRKRLTREESRDLTRQRLLDAAAVLIAKKGFAAASVEDIAAHAGYTRGAFYSNFTSKTDLFIALLKRDHEDMHQDLQQILSAGLSIEDTQRQLTLCYLKAYRDSNNFALWAEARLLALRDGRFRARFSALCLEKRDVIAYFITQFCALMKKNPPGPAADLAFGTMALIDGMRFFNTCMPNELPDEAAQAVLGTIFNATFFDRAG